MNAAFENPREFLFLRLELPGILCLWNSNHRPRFQFVGSDFLMNGSMPTLPVHKENVIAIRFPLDYLTWAAAIKGVILLLAT